MPDPDTDPNEPEGGGMPDWRRLLDGYAEPGRLRRLREQQRNREVGRIRWLGRQLRRLVGFRFSVRWGG